ncbi:ribonuclease J [Candidatus Odyssella thessalonicensis]|uniref:ribonuclease J n=1 Tax=Candidatus Odyssella thessalonicensis TaxID=84647 RepID=UPI000225AEA8|nr:ribonuclease J [Candidatus Odyssella thessalonicensis]
MQVPGKNDFWFLPLGGSGEIGMNLNLYGHDGQWLMVDLGVTFGDRFGIDIITPDPEFIVSQRERLAGLLLTHAHEDHIGAIPYLWPMLKCPIYATKFTAEIVRQKLKEVPWGRDVKIIEVPLSGELKVGKFLVEYITLTHSIPEPNALAIATPLGTVIHTGDWKIDPDPLVGGLTDAERLQDWGEQGILALVCDSTNVFKQGVAGSEETVRQEIFNQIGMQKGKRVIIACFASNLARVETAILAAAKHGRKVCLVGRSLHKMVEAAQKVGYLRDIPTFIDEETAMKLPPDEVMIISTGSQGEPRAALSRMAADSHPQIKLDHRDVVFFSSRIIPGNERAINLLQNNLVRKGVGIITSHDEENIHVSGHPARSELMQMYQWVKPKLLIPVHGELRHMTEQAELGLSCGIAKAVVPENGTVIQLDEHDPKIIDRIPVGRLGYDGSRMVPMVSPMLSERGKLAVNGAVFVTLALDRHGDIDCKPVVSLLGITIGGQEQEGIERDILRAIKTCVNNSYQDLDTLQEEIRVNIRRVTNNWIGKKALTEVHILQV